jgi:hypothetical protein
MHDNIPGRSERDVSQFRGRGEKIASLRVGVCLQLIAGNAVAVVINFLNVGAYWYFVRRERKQ